jgi:hypothetical protein
MTFTVKLFADEEDFPANGTFEGDVVPCPILFRAKILRVEFFGFHDIGSYLIIWLAWTFGFDAHNGDEGFHCWRVLLLLVQPVTQPLTLPMIHSRMERAHIFPIKALLKIELRPIVIIFGFQ